MNARESRTFEARPWLRRILPAALLTCAVALYNHFPLTYPDSGNYLGNAYSMAHGQEPSFFFRPLAYGLYLVPFATRYTIWLLPLAQGILVAVVVDLTLRGAAVSLSNAGFFALFAALSAFTSLPWFSGQLMPDIFTSLVILLAFVIVWGTERQSRGEQWRVGILLTLAIASHLSHFPLYGMLLIGGLVGRALVDRESRCWGRFGPLALRAITPLVVAVGLVMGPNLYFYREPVLSRSSSLFALGHLVGDSIAQRYLERACPTRHYRLCSDQPFLRANVDWFLWSPAGTWKQHAAEMQRGDSTILREAPAIVWGALRQEWPAVISVTLRNTLAQLTTFEFQRGEHRFSNSVQETMKRLGPRILRAYGASGQVRNSLPVEAASRVLYAAVGIGLLGLLGSLPALTKRASSPVQALIATVCLGVVLNALVVVSLASVQARYQSRVIWLVPLVGAVAAGHLVGERARRGRQGETSRESLPS
jgi:hypothetical protein